MRAGKVAGIQFILNNWFLLIVTLFAATGMTGKILAVFSAVLWHELAHAVVALVLGFKVREVELLPFGGVARIDKLSEANAKQDMMIAVAGPLSSLVLAAAVYVLRLQYPAWSEELSFYFEVNCMLAVFNLLPAMPLDGGRIFRSWLSGFMSYSQATVCSVAVTKVVALSFVLFAVYSYIYAGTIQITVIMAAVFLYSYAKAERRAASLRGMQMLAQKKAVLISQGVMATTYFTVLEQTPVREVIRLISSANYHMILVVDADCHVQGILTETEVWQALPEHGFFTKIGEFLQ